MIIYFVTFISVILYGCVFFFKGVTKRNKITFLCLAFVHIGFVMAMRSYEVGIDTHSYYLYFLRWGATQRKVGGATQPLYYLYNRLLYLFCHHGQILIIFNSLLEVIGIALFMYHFSENVFLSTYLWITLYFFCESMNTSRQFLALSIFMIAYTYLWKKNNIKVASFFFLMSIGIHNLSFTLLPIFLAYFIRPNKEKIVILSLFGMFLSFNFDKIIPVFINVFCEIFPYYSQYLESGWLNVYNTGGNRNLLLTLFYLGFIILALFALADREVPQKSKDKIIFLLVPCIITVVIGFGATNILSLHRIKMIYSVFFICLIPNTIACFEKKNRVIANIFVLLITILPFVVLLSENYGGVVPYKFFWQ